MKTLLTATALIALSLGASLAFAEQQGVVQIETAKDVQIANIQSRHWVTSARKIALRDWKSASYVGEIVEDSVFCKTDIINHPDLGTSLVVSRAHLPYRPNQYKLVGILRTSDASSGNDNLWKFRNKVLQECTYPYISTNYATLQDGSKVYPSREMSPNGTVRTIFMSIMGVVN